MADIEMIQKICLSLKAVTEDVKWDNVLVFSIGKKIFCLVGLESPSRCTFKVREEDFEELSTRDGFMQAPYMARAKWVSVSNAAKLSKKEWEAFIQQSYELVKAKLTKKQKNELGL